MPQQPSGSENVKFPVLLMEGSRNVKGEQFGKRKERVNLSISVFCIL